MESVSEQDPDLAKPGCRERVSVILAILLAVIFAIGLPLALILFDIGEVIFSPDTVSEAVVTNVLETGALQNLLLEYVFIAEVDEIQRDEAGSFKGALEHLKSADIEAIVNILIPSSWAETQITLLVSDLYLWLDSDQIYPKLSLNIQPVKDRLRSGGSREIAEIVLDSWPSCSMEQINRARTQIERTGELPIVACEPPEPMRGELLMMADQVLMDRINELPGSMRLFDPSNDNFQESEVREFKENIRFIRAWSNSSWLLILSILGLILALIVRSFQDLAKWWGYPLLVSGLILFLLVLLVSDPFTRRIERILRSSDLPAVFQESIQGIAQYLQEEFVGLALVQFILLIGSGIGLLFLAYLLRRRQKSQT